MSKSLMDYEVLLMDAAVYVRKVNEENARLRLDLGKQAEATKRVIWIRPHVRDGKENPELWVYCDVNGEPLTVTDKYGHTDTITVLDMRLYEARALLDFVGVEIREWEPPHPWGKTDGDLKEYLHNLLLAVLKGEMTGLEASLAKWDACIDFTKTTGEISKYWGSDCGLCREYVNSSACPLSSKRHSVSCEAGCTNHSAWRGMCRTAERGDCGEWLRYAREFRQWITDTCSKSKK